MSKIIKIIDGKTYLQLSDASPSEKAKMQHDLDAAFFRIKHIARMLDDGRPIDDFNDEMKQGFQQAIECLEVELEVLRQAYEN